MVTGWKAPRARPIKPIAQADAHQARRDALSKRFPGEHVIVATGHEKTRANDTTYRFRPGTDFYYLTGNQEPDCVLALVPEGRGHRHVLFVEPNPGKTDSTFFTDRQKGELWVGPRLGVPQSATRYGLEARPLTELPEVLEAAQKAPFRVLRGIDPALDAKVALQAERDVELAQFLSELRLLKDKAEVAELKRAIDATQRGFEDVIRGLPRFSREREVEGVFNMRARLEGNDVGYNTIAASGAHACILHWTPNDGTFGPRDLLLLDAGVEAHSLYTADITRTLPVGGKFSREQREIYQLVLDAQKAAFKQVKPGLDFMAPNVAAMEVLAHGLARLGILKGTPEDALKDEHQFYKRYSLHNVSHMLGLDVHDCAQARMEAYKFGKLQAGMVLTVEPGLYFQLDDLTVPAKYRGIGVRIEDDVVVTERGCKVLSDGIPREAAEVESWMKRTQADAKKSTGRRKSARK
jgi:Xaa-Pro aminopeptidase